MINRSELNRLFRYALALGASEPDAADLVQETLEKTLLHFSGSESIKEKWMRKTLRNKHIDQLRRLQRFQHFELDTVDEQEVYALDTDSLEDLMIKKGEFKDCWDLLKQSEREVVYLWAIEGYTAAEIGEQMDCSRNTILSKIHRIKIRLVKAAKKKLAVGMTSGEAQ